MLRTKHMLRTKQKIIATMLRHGRPDLANKVAVAYHPLTGTTVWGKDSVIHFYAGVARLEEYQPEHPRGKQAKVIEILEWDEALKADPGFQDEIKNFLAALKTKSYKQAFDTFRTAIDKHNNGSQDSWHSIKITERMQRGIDAPAPLDELNSPKNLTNAKNVKIDVDPREKQVTLNDLDDKMNEPRAFTQGPAAYKKAVEMFNQWRDLDYDKILLFWSKNAIKYHDYLAMD